MGFEKNKVQKQEITKAKEERNIEKEKRKARERRKGGKKMND